MLCWGTRASGTASDTASVHPGRVLGRRWLRVQNSSEGTFASSRGPEGKNPSPHCYLVPVPGGGQTWLGVTAGALASPRLVFLLPEEEAAGVGAAPSPCFCGWVEGWEICEGGGFLWFVCLMCRKRFSPSSWVCHLPFCHPCPPAPREAVGGSSTPHPALLPTPPPPPTAPQSSAFSRGLPL